MNDELKKVFSEVMYLLTKECSYYDLKEYFNLNGIKDEDWEEIKKYLKDNYNVQTYE